MSKSVFPQGVKPVLVEWIDSIATSGWADFKEPDMRCTTVGHITKETKTTVTVALNRSASCDGHYITIPRVAIKRIRKLR